MAGDGDHFSVVWIDFGRDPRCPSNPRHPQGVDVDATQGCAGPSCLVALEYPAKRCGAYSLRCRLCDVRVMLTTAGRPDDPRSVRVPCSVDGQEEVARA